MLAGPKARSRRAYSAVSQERRETPYSSGRRCLICQEDMTRDGAYEFLMCGHAYHCACVRNMIASDPRLSKEYACPLRCVPRPWENEEAADVADAIASVASAEALAAAASSAAASSYAASSAAAPPPPALSPAPPTTADDAEMMRAIAVALDLTSDSD
jgi:hypothetical protein